MKAPHTPLAAVMAVALAGWAVAETPPSEVKHGELGAVEASLTGKPGDPASGREIVSAKSLGNCIACHANSDMAEVPWHGEVGPPLDGAGDRWTAAQLRGIIVNSKAVFPGTIMPAFYKVDGFIRPGEGYTGGPAETVEPILTAQQIEDVVAYLATLKEQ